MKIGLVLIIAEHPELRRAYSYPKTREIAQQAEEAIRNYRQLSEVQGPKKAT
jgi:hypothetical protein